VRNCRRLVDVVGPADSLAHGAPKLRRALGGFRPSCTEIVCAGLSHARFHAQGERFVADGETTALLPKRSPAASAPA